MCRPPSEGGEQLDDLPTDPEAPRCAWAARLPTPADPSRRVATAEKLFLEVGVGGFPVHRAHDAALSERHHCARSATTRANSPAARTCQHVTASPVVPAHKVGLDGVLSEQHRHWILDMSGRYVPVDVHAVQSLNPTSARLLPVNAEPATVSRSWQARTLRLTAAGPSADDAEARRSQVEQ
jgi:hypothetical protein